MATAKYSFEKQRSPFPSRYNVVKMLNFAKRIYHATNSENNTQVAIKELINNRSLVKKYNQKELTFAEMCQQLSSENYYNPHILKYYEVIVDEQSIFIVMELCDYDLEQKLKRENFHQKPKTIEYLCQALDIFKQVLVGYQYLLNRFGPQFMHRDIKPQNVLYSEKEKMYKICDFGLCKIDEFDNPTAYVGTQNYMAPEIQQGERYDNRCDVYSMGVLLYWIITGESQTSNLKKIIKNENLLEMLDWMLLPNPDQRIPWNKLFQNNIFVLSPKEFLNNDKNQVRASLISTQAFSQILPIDRSPDKTKQSINFSSVNTSYLKRNNCSNYLKLNTLFVDTFKQLPQQDNKISSIQRCLFALWTKIYDNSILNETCHEIKFELSKCKDIIQLQQLLRLQNQNNDDLNIEFYPISDLCKYLLTKINLWKENQDVMKRLKKFLEMNAQSQNIIFPQ